MWKIILILLIFYISLDFFNSLKILQNSLNSTNLTRWNMSEQVPCRNNSDCNFGNCNNTSKHCECDKGYLNTENNELVIPCFYQQKRQYDAFVLEMIVGFGSGQFYLSRNGQGVLKLFAYLFAIISICLFPLTLRRCHTRTHSSFLAFGIAFTYCFLAIGFAAWYIHDLVVIRKGYYTDGKGFPLLSWSA
jgi:hypothetical protein